MATEFNHVQRNGKFYIFGADVHFLVEKQGFRVHRYFFERESRHFLARLEAPASPGSSRQGTDNSTAIRLDTTCDAFEKFLGIFYNPKYSLYEYSVHDWTKVLELAENWGFPEVKDLAIREVERMELPVLERIALYQRFKVDPQVLVRYYADLCRSPEALTYEGSQAIGLETAVLIFRARELLRAQPSDEGRSPLPAGLEHEDVCRAINGLLDPQASSGGPSLQNKNGSGVPGDQGAKTNGGGKQKGKGKTPQTSG